MNFGHYTDASVGVAVDLINAYGTVPLAAAGHGDEPLPDPAAFLRDRGFDAAGVTRDDAGEVQRLADELHEAFMTDDPADAVDILNAVLAAAAVLPQISGHDDSPWHLHYQAADAAPVDQLAAVAAMGLATVLCTDGTSRLGRCDGLTCRDVYVDTSRNNRRRFCSDGCANLAHVTAHRARQRAEAHPD